MCYLHGNPAGLGSAERRALVELRDVAVAWCVFLLVKLLTDEWRQRVRPEPICIAYSVQKLLGKNPDVLPDVAKNPTVSGVQASVKYMPARLRFDQITGPAIKSTLKSSTAPSADTLTTML